MGRGLYPLGTKRQFFLDRAVYVLQLFSFGPSRVILTSVVSAAYRCFAMLVGTLSLEALITGIIDPVELYWLASHQSDFSRLEEATALRLGRLLDQGVVQLG